MILLAFVGLFAGVFCVGVSVFEALMTQNWSKAAWFLLIGLSSVVSSSSYIEKGA